MRGQFEQLAGGHSRLEHILREFDQKRQMSKITPSQFESVSQRALNISPVREEIEDLQRANNDP